jgi:hypothetical protein
MSNQVFANMMEVSCKAASGKAIAAFPDVCFTPPTTPATPPGVPIPYPNTGMASDCTDGSRTVKISGQEVMLKNKSYFKQSTGDEPGSAPKKGVVTSKIKGKVYFTKWSMDVKVEGENVVRHFDLSTHNHGSMPGNTIPWMYTDTMSAAKIKGKECKKMADDFNEHCGPAMEANKRPADSPLGEFNKEGLARDMCADGNEKCKEARKCILMAKKVPCCPTDDGKSQTGHHVVPKSQFKGKGKGAAALPLIDDEATYDPEMAPCICAQGRSHSVGKHGEIHAATNKKTRAAMGVAPNTEIPDTKRWSVADAERIGAEAVEEETECPKECTQQQLRAGHQAMGVKPNDQIRPTTAGGEKPDLDVDA